LINKAGSKSTNSQQSKVEVVEVSEDDCESCKL
jgi:hypothetical protein